MFRWLKDRKKAKKGRKKGDVTDDYGFQSRNREEDKDYHIYEEIPDLPQFAERDEQTTSRSLSDPELSFDQSFSFSADTLRKYIIGSQDKLAEGKSKKDGPYMVVPILNSKEEKPPLPPPNEKRSVFTCALVGRRHSSLSRSTESGVEVSYDSSESHGSETNLADVKHIEDEVLSPESSGESSSGSRTHAREGSLDTSDTGCEYDMSTSSESDQVNYEYYLSKIEQNLAHKCKIREIIQQAVPEEDESDCESLTSVSSVSRCSVKTTRMASGRRTVDGDSDEGTLADHSESENSSGYYETFATLAGKGLGSGLKCSQKDSDSVKHQYVKNKKKCVQKRNKNRNVDALGLCVPGVTAERICAHRNIDALGLSLSDKSAFRKFKSATVLSRGQSSLDRGSSASRGSTPSLKLDLYEPLSGSSVYGLRSGVSSVDSEGREVYSPPPSVKDFVPRNPVPPKCSMARAAGSSNVYRSGGSHNRLLSDLIIMNYDRQLFIR